MQKSTQENTATIDYLNDGIFKTDRRMVSYRLGGSNFELGLPIDSCPMSASQDKYNFFVGYLDRKYQAKYGK